MEPIPSDGRQHVDAVGPPRKNVFAAHEKRRLEKNSQVVLMEAAGIEPSFDFDATGLLPCGCVICEECRAALALHSWRPEWLEVAFDDADLQRIVAAWVALPEAIRRAVVVLIEWQET